MNLLRRILSLRLFSRKEKASDFWDIIIWWELRRIPFNLLVGLAGIVTLAVILAVAAIASEKFGEPLGLPDPPFIALFMVIGYAVAANLCYTGGWVAEILARRLWGPDQAEHFAVISFFFGLLFAAGLTLAPSVLFTFLLILRLIVS